MALDFTASGLGRVVACNLSALLPGVDSITGAGTRGTARHAFFEAIPSVGREGALRLAPEEMREELARIDIDALADVLAPGALAQEVAFLLNVLDGTGREVGRSIGRAYPERERGEVAGTADVVALLGENGVYVGDYKGQDPSTPHAADNLQMRFLALAACRTYGRSHAVVELIHVKDDGSHYRTRAELDALDLDDFEADLRALYLRLEERQVTGEVVSPVEGAHCRRCPAFSNCPAKVALARELAHEARAYEKEQSVAPVLTLEDAQITLARLEAGEQLLEHIRSRLEEYAREHPFATGRGAEVFGPVDKVTEKAIPAKAALVLSKELDAMAAHAALETRVSTSWERINQQVSAYVKRQPKDARPRVGELQARIRKALREGDAIETKAYTRVERHTPEAPPVALPGPEAPALGDVSDTSGNASAA